MTAAGDVSVLFPEKEKKECKGCSSPVVYSMSLVLFTGHTFSLLHSYDFLRLGSGLGIIIIRNDIQILVYKLDQ